MRNGRREERGVSEAGELSEAAAVSGEPILRSRVLLADRDRREAEGIRRALETSRYEVIHSESMEGAHNVLAQSAVPALICETRSAGIDGLRLLQAALERDPESCVILIADANTVGAATRGVLEGAADYQVRPVNLDKIRAVLRRNERLRGLVAEVLELNRRLDAKYGLGDIVGSSPALSAVVQRLLQVAPTDATVLITGETGSGKELIGTAIHQNSSRRKAALIKLHCGDLTEGLVESELFGHVKGAFTGAVADRKGRFELADKGTLFLDEVGELSPATQVKLLRVLQDGEIVRVGAERSIKVDVRLIAATNRDLRLLVERGEFREDLFYRLNVVSIQIPPLRQRPQDIPLLADHFLREAATAYRRRISGITRRALHRMVRYPWPGNVRELKNVMISMTVKGTDGQPLDVEDLPAPIRAMPEEGLDILVPVGVTWAEAERRIIEATLKSVDYDLDAAARTLDVSKRTLYRRLREYRSARR
mgnify:CR=1 FL=1